MTHISLDSHGEAVKQFFLNLPLDPTGSVVELNGRPVARVLPLAGDNGAGEAVEWTEAKNARRCALIDKEMDGTLSLEEADELLILQRAMLRYRRRVAPLPLEDARRLHQELLGKAQERGA